MTISLPEPLSMYAAVQVEPWAYEPPLRFVEALVADYRIRLEETLLAALDETPIEISNEEWASGDVLAVARERLALHQ